jgi:rhodanese-related sulfurtransferase
VTTEQVGDRRVLDIRQRPEFAGGHIPGAVHVELGDLADAAGRLPQAPTVVMCGHGERAAGAASLLERAGRSDVGIFVGGPDDWAQATGRPLRDEQ